MTYFSLYDMDESRKRRLSYTRKWKSARREVEELQKTQFSEVSDSSDDENVLNRILNYSSSVHNVQEDATVSLVNNIEEPSTITTDVEESDHDADRLNNSPNATERDIWISIDQQNTFSISSGSDSGSDSDIYVENFNTLSYDINAWANNCQIKHNHLDQLLTILKKHGHYSLPSTARTLLKTPRTIPTCLKSGMQYSYLGLKPAISNYLKKYPLELVDNLTELDISLNIDGLPLFHSNFKCAWPVLCAILLKPVSVFPVALTFGNKKPADLLFLHDTLNEINEIMQSGIEFGTRIIKINLRCIICDSPAKSMVKCTKLYSGYFGCDRCEQKGSWAGKVIYPETDNLILRTDQSFRSQTQEEHHHDVSPFCALNIDMIKSFPIDYMHQVCLGVMKRLLLVWMRGKRATKLSASQISEISKKLHVLKPFITSQFARKPRNLEEIDRWKATELRQFLLYTGMLVLKGILNQELYDHFMVLSVAMRILVSSKLIKNFTQYACSLLKYFVEQGNLLYGEEFLVYNVHTLLHITEDVETHGNLDNFSAFPFENFLHKVKRLVRSGKSPLTQIIKRIEEMDALPLETNSRKKFSIKEPNNSYILENSKCCDIIGITNENENNEKKMLCRVYQNVAPRFLKPCNSQLVGVYVVDGRYSRIQLLDKKDIQINAIRVPDSNKFIFMAILHDF